MSNALGHSIFAAIITIFFISILNASMEVKITAGIIAFGFAFLPDIDHPKAVARKAYREFGTIIVALVLFAMLWIYGKMEVVLAIALSALLAIAFIKISEKFMPKHRGITHKFAFAGMLAVAMYIIMAVIGNKHAAIYAISGLIGYCSHIILDRMPI